MKTRLDKVYGIVDRYCSKSIKKELDAVVKEGEYYCGDCIPYWISRVKGRTDFLKLLYKEVTKYLDRKSDFDKFKKEVDEVWKSRYDDITGMNAYEKDIVQLANVYRNATINEEEN